MSNPEVTDTRAYARPPRGIGEKVLAFVGLPYQRRAEIDRQDFEAAQGDSALEEFSQEAREEGERLEREGRIHP